MRCDDVLYLDEFLSIMVHFLQFRLSALERAESSHTFPVAGWSKGAEVGNKEK